MFLNENNEDGGIVIEIFVNLRIYLEKMPEYSPIQTIKRRFFAMRNGVIADTLRKAGMPYRIIFGLNMPQIAEIASETLHDAALARQLWADTGTRESMMLAPMIYPRAELTPEMIADWLREAPTTEVADTMCLKLLRYHSDAFRVASETLAGEVSGMPRYSALRLLMNLLTLAQSPAGAEAGLAAPETIARALRPLVTSEASKADPLTRQLAAQMLDEIDFLLE